MAPEPPTKEDKKKLVEPDAHETSIQVWNRKEPFSLRCRRYLLVSAIVVCAVAILTSSAMLLLSLHAAFGKKCPDVAGSRLQNRMDDTTLPLSSILAPQTRCKIRDIVRIDCLPGGGASQSKCKAKGCCWVPASEEKAKGIPWCFYPIDTGYNMSRPLQTPLGYTANLTRKSTSHWPDDVMTLQMDVKLETRSRVHFRIFDPKNKRYEVPIETPKVTSKVSQTDYKVTLKQVPAGLTITRASTGSKIFDTTEHQLTFADQFIEISSSLPTKYLYGFGEHRRRFWLDASKDKRISFWAGDNPPAEGANLYGTHPFFMGLEEDGNAYGVFLLNSNAMDVIISNQVITYRTIGGILDFWVFIGPSPDDVISQYTAVIGRPLLPPYWALGFHLCRWGYKDEAYLRKIIKRMRDGKFPYDTQWNDIDYMYKRLDWTRDNRTYKHLPSIVEDLHNHTQHYVMLVDPGIHNISGYKPYTLGLRKDIFIKAADGSGPIIGRVWPGHTAFPDFSNPVSYDYWYELADGYHRKVPFDGMWIDMNEPSNFVDGSVKGCSAKNKYDNPPYVPGVVGGHLFSKTLCPSSLQHVSNHYNLHSLYGHFEIVQTNKVLTKLRKKRAFIVSRSTFAGSGRYGYHWLGDNSADWKNLHYSIPAILNFNMFGIPFIGADICGFSGNTTAELCTRWIQLGAFYPFMRNHNSVGMMDQDPANPVFPKTAQDAMRKALILRYTLLPTLYSLLYRSLVTGAGVARPLFFQYPKDKKTYDIDRQFMWGEALMISPVLKKGATSVKAYFPKDIWYDFTTGEKEVTSGDVKLDAPLDKINVHMRGGTIVATQGANVTTTLSRKNPFGLVVALPASSERFSFLMYWDDGDSLMPATGGKAIGNLIEISASKTRSGGSVNGAVKENNYKTSMILGTVRIFGAEAKPKSVTVQGKQHREFTYESKSKVLLISTLGLEISDKDFVIQWL